jgi:outer membrane immunogenic protein
MRAKRSLTIAAALLAGSITAAAAADMPVAPPPPPAYNWTGWYLGVGVAGVWGESRQTFDPFVIPGILFLPGGTVGPEFEQAMITFHGGRLHQFGNFGWGSIVVGLDSSASIPLDDSFGTTVVCPNLVTDCSTRIQALFTTGGVLGLAWYRFLISARGGFASGLVETRVSLLGIPLNNTETWHTGWYVGGAIDWAVYKTAGTSGILGLEYQYVDLGEREHCPFGCRVDLAASST